MTVVVEAVTDDYFPEEIITVNVKTIPCNCQGHCSGDSWLSEWLTGLLTLSRALIVL